MKYEGIPTKAANCQSCMEVAKSCMTQWNDQGAFSSTVQLLSLRLKHFCSRAFGEPGKVIRDDISRLIKFGVG